FWKDSSVDTTWTSVDTLSQSSPESVLGGPLVSTLPQLVSTPCPKQPREVFWVVMKNPWSRMGLGKSDEHPS
ncbi:hypothetical protein Taro_056867, partial [Colocasia esculenta]|nr:hypothetical protein [Colocasia esculenta]